MLVQREGAPDLHYEVDDFTDPWRPAPTVVLLHGNGRSGKFWYRSVPYIARYYEVIRPDMRGLGRSPVQFDVQAEMVMEDLVEDLRAVLDHNGSETVHLCGEALGGILGAAFAAAHPDRVKSLTIVGTPVFIEKQMKERYALGHSSRIDAMKAMGTRAWVAETTRITRLPEAEDPGLFNWYVDEYSQGDPDVQVVMSALVNRADATGFFKALRCPVLGLYPRGGQIAGEDQQRRLKEAIADFRINYFETRYQMIHLIYPRECAERLLDFCATIDGGKLDYQ